MHSRQAVVGHRSGLSCAAVRVEAPFGQVPQCIGVWRLGCGGPVHLVSYLRRLVCCFVCGHVNQSTNPFDDNHVAAQCMRTLRHVALL